MIYGAYFIPKERWREAVRAGLRFCVRPIIKPDRDGDGTGFVTENAIRDMTTGKVVWRYLIDEADISGKMPMRVSLEHAADAAKHPDAWYFFTVTGRQNGRHAWRYRAALADLRGCIYYPYYRSDGYRALPLTWLYRVRRILSGMRTAFSAGRAWKGLAWAGVAQVVEGGLLDRKTSQPMSVRAVRMQIGWWRAAGAHLCFFWRADIPHGWDTILATMRSMY